MTVSQALAVNRILEELLGERRDSTTTAQIVESGAMLAKHAQRTLLAGISEEVWREKFVKRNTP